MEKSYMTRRATPLSEKYLVFVISDDHTRYFNKHGISYPAKIVENNTYWFLEVEGEED